MVGMPQALQWLCLRLPHCAKLSQVAVMRQYQLSSHSTVVTSPAVIEAASLVSLVPLQHNVYASDLPSGLLLYPCAQAAVLVQSYNSRAAQHNPCDSYCL